MVRKIKIELDAEEVEIEPPQTDQGEEVEEVPPEPSDEEQAASPEPSDEEQAAPPESGGEEQEETEESPREAENEDTAEAVAAREPSDPVEPEPAVSPPAAERDKLQQRTLQKPDGAVRRFKKWLGGTTPVGKPMAKGEAAISPDDSIGDADALESEALLTPQAARKEMKALKSSRRSWSTIVKTAEDGARQAQEEIERSEIRLKALNDWVGQFDRSYQWKVQQRMDQQLAQAETDLRTYEQSAQNVEEFEPGRLVELRKTFHKLIGQPTMYGILAGILAFLIPVLFQIRKVEALEIFYDPRLSAPIIILSVIAVIVVVFLVRRALGQDTVRNSTIVKWVVFAIGVGLLIIVLPTVENRARAELVPFLEENQWGILVAIVAVLVVWTFIALTIYYQGWSKYRRGVETQLAKLHAVISGYVESQQEVNRLALLYQQTTEWLKILAFALYRPWTTHEDWEKSKEVDADFQDFPFALRIAEVDDQVGAKSAELERVIASKLLVQGWRADAFDDLVRQVAADMGVGSDKFSVESLDKDLPHQTNNTRNLLVKYLEASAKTLVDGEEKVSKANRYLVEVARKRLVALIEQTQSVALSAARPPVNQITNDPLDQLSVENIEKSEDESSENWDDFLRESLGTDEIVQPPLSVLNFTPEGQMNKAGEDPQTFILIPQRLADAMSKDAGKTVKMVPVSDHSAKPVEIIARMDVAGPLDFSALRLLNVAKTRVSQQRSQQQEKSTRVQQLCQLCHDPTCPASTDSRRTCANSQL